MDTEPNDWLWFSRHRDRTYRCRPATPAEFSNLRMNGHICLKALDGGRLVHCLVRNTRYANEMERLYVAILPRDEMDENDSRRAWVESDAIMGAIERRGPISRAPDVLKDRRSNLMRRR